MNYRTLLMTVALAALLSASVTAQTSAFNFQGRLNDGSTAANGQFDLQFKLFSLISGGTQVGSTINRPGLTLINGVFSTTLDFGSAAFGGSNRFLEISVRPTGSSNAHVVLGARQQILAVPFAVRSISAAQADNATIAEFAVGAGNAQNSTLFAGLSTSEFARLNFQNNGELRVGGNVAIGTSTPASRLTLSGGPSWSSSLWTASMNMQNASAIGWEANNSGQRFGIGQTNGGLNFFRTTSPFGATAVPAQTDLTIADNGNLTQPLATNGVMKAMLAVTANGTIVRCYNGVTGATTNNCGFTVTVNGTPSTPLGFVVDFPFDVSTRFWVVTAERSATGLSDQTAGVQLSPGATQTLLVSTHVDGTEVYRPFHLLIF